MTDKKLIREIGDLIFKHFCKREIRLDQSIRVLRQLNLSVDFEVQK